MPSASTSSQAGSGGSRAAAAEPRPWPDRPRRSTGGGGPGPGQAWRKAGASASVTTAALTPASARMPRRDAAARPDRRARRPPRRGGCRGSPPRPRGPWAGTARRDRPGRPPSAPAGWPAGRRRVPAWHRSVCGRPRPRRPGGQAVRAAARSSSWLRWGRSIGNASCDSPFNPMGASRDRLAIGPGGKRAPYSDWSSTRARAREQEQPAMAQGVGVVVPGGDLELGRVVGRRCSSGRTAGWRGAPRCRAGRATGSARSVGGVGLADAGDDHAGQRHALRRQSAARAPSVWS